MTINAEDFLATAEKNIKSASNEADYRCCITRAYYCSYNASIKYQSTLDKLGNSKAKVGEHENLIHQLNNPNIPSTDKNYLISKELSRYLLKMRYQRTKADYHLHLTVTETEAKTTIAETTILVETIKAA